MANLLRKSNRGDVVGNIKFLVNEQSHHRVDELTSLPDLGKFFSRLGRAVYEGSKRVESREGEFSASPINGKVLSHNTANDVVEAISNLQPPQLSDDFQNAVSAAIPDIRACVEAYVGDRVIKDGKFCGNGHHVRQYLQANVMDVVGKKMGF